MTLLLEKSTTSFLNFNFPKKKKKQIDLQDFRNIKNKQNNHATIGMFSLNKDSRSKAIKGKKHLVVQSLHNASDFDKSFRHLWVFSKDSHFLDTCVQNPLAISDDSQLLKMSPPKQGGSYDFARILDKLAAGK